MAKITSDEIKARIHTEEYDFLKTNPALGKNLVLLCVGGSRAYGTATPTSDLDIRGIAVNNKRGILTDTKFEQVVDEKTDTVIYSLDKIVKLFSLCNPNTLEMLGVRDEDVLYCKSSMIGELLSNKTIFLSQRAAYTFGGYANAQLRRLQNKSVRVANQTEQERNLLKSIEYAEVEWKDKYLPNSKDLIRLYVDKSERDDMDSEIYMDCNFSYYPLRDYKDMWSEIKQIVNSYKNVGQRNKNAVEHSKLGKHMMHLVRLYLMCFDILEKKEIVTYRAKEKDFLLDIRNGKYIDENGQIRGEFFDLLNELEKRFVYARDNTDLPKHPDEEKIKDIQMAINDKICKGE